MALGGVALLVGIASLWATWAGLGGSWVADDWHMVHSYLYGDWAELGAVFRRNAGYYLFTEDQTGPYRPITMLTLLGTHLIAPEPLLHHTVSWVLHAGTASILFAALRDRLREPLPSSPGAVDTASLLVASLFFLHPSSVETYVWINGRSDLMGGFWLVALAFLLSSSERGDARHGLRALAVALVAFLGAGSKLPFVIAATACWLAWAIGLRRPGRGLYGIALLVAFVVHGILRSVYAPFSGSIGSSEAVLFDPSVWQAIPKLLSSAVVAWASLRAEAMQSLSWVLFRPWESWEWMGLASIVVAIVLLVRRRDWPTMVYVLGAFVTLVPVVVVSRSFWMGFDRYLYMPSILLALAIVPYVQEAIFRRDGSARRGALVAAAVLLAGAAWQTHRASDAYRSQESYDAALLRDHADDPTIYYYFARAADRLGDEKAVRANLEAMPPPPWPRPIIVPTYELASKADDPMRAIQALEALLSSVDEGQRCSKVVAQLQAWLDRDPEPALSAALHEAMGRLSCEDS